MKTLEELKRLENVLIEPHLPRAEREWGGADVVISHKMPSSCCGKRNSG